MGQPIPIFVPQDAIVFHYLDDCRLRGLAPTTIQQRRYVLSRLSRWFGHPLLRATADDLDAWARTLLRLAAQSRRTEMMHVRSFYRWALAHDHIEEDPCRRLVPPRIGRGIPRPIPHADLDLALRTAPLRVRPWLFLAADCGLRAGEIAVVRRSDFYAEDDGWRLLIHGKGGRERVIPVPEQVVEALQEAALPEHGWLFPRRDGRPGHIEAHMVSRLTNRHLHSLGIRSTLHTLRHRAATDWLRDSHDLRLTQELLGHQSPTTTAGYAAHADDRAVDVVTRVAERRSVRPEARDEGGVEA